MTLHKMLQLYAEELECKTKRALTKAVSTCTPKDRRRICIDCYLYTVSEDVLVSIDTHIQQWLETIKA